MTERTQDSRFGGSGVLADDGKLHQLIIEASDEAGAEGVFGNLGLSYDGEIVSEKAVEPWWEE